MNIKVLIVVYNKSLSESLTVNSIGDAGGAEIFIADNSTEDFNNGAFARERGFHYVDMEGNQGLSKAYNRVLSMLEKNDGVICLFDDDTTVPNDYFKILREDSERFKEIDIFAPVVMDGKGILSPCIFSGVSGKRIKRLENIPLRGISAINSGLAVRLSVFTGYKYDEGLFLDYIDHAFIRDTIGQDSSKIHIMNVVLKQSFTGSGNSGRNEALKRYKTFKKDVRYFCGKYGIPQIKCSVFLIKRKIKIIIKSIVRRKNVN